MIEDDRVHASRARAGAGAGAGCYVHKEPRWVRQRGPPSATPGAPGKLWKSVRPFRQSSTYPIFKLSLRQIIPLQCESWFVVQIPVPLLLVRPQDLFCTPRFPSWAKISIPCVPHKRSAEASGENRVQTSGASRASASPNARSKHHESTLGDSPEARGRPPSVALSSTLSDISKKKS